MKTLTFENLIDVKTGKTVELEVPSDFPEDKDFEKAGKLGASSAEKLLKEFGNHD